MDAVLAARWQMTLSLVFHIVFAAIGIGLPLLLVLIERRWLVTGQEHYLRLAKKWAKATGILFAVGAISGTALSLELGLLFPGFMEVCGAVVGHLFGLEGFAFFVEAIFIGLYLYGWDKLSPRAHWWCGVCIAVSGAVSGLLILGVNAWMQLPVGFTMQEGKIVVTDPLAIFGQYGWLTMAIHSTLACYMAVGFAVAGIYAFGWLRGRRDAYHRSAILTAMAVGGIAGLLQPLSGDFLAKFVYRRDPVKFAAMEGQFVTQTHAPLRIGGLPDEARGVTRWAIEVPSMLSFLAAHRTDAKVWGLNDIAPEPHQRPPVALTHLSFQIMVGLGGALALVSIWFWIAHARRREAGWSRPLLWAMVILGAGGFVALETGWIVTEVGRQPWVVVGTERLAAMRAAGGTDPWAGAGYPGLLTRQTVTSASGVQTVFYGFTVLYILLGVTVVWLLRYLARGRAR
jgi:cytochrome d ubiquinol oxidase subunit I